MIMLYGPAGVVLVVFRPLMQFMIEKGDEGKARRAESVIDIETGCYK